MTEYGFSLSKILHNNITSEPRQYFSVPFALAERQSVAVTLEEMQLPRLTAGELLARDFQSFGRRHTAIRTAMQHQ